MEKEKITSKDIVFGVIIIVVGILTTMFYIGIGLSWYSDWEPYTTGDILTALSLIIFCCLCIDFVTWGIISLIIWSFLYEE